MKKVSARIILMIVVFVALCCLNVEVNEELNNEEVYSKILTEFLSNRIEDEEEIIKVVIKKEFEKESLEEELNYDDLGYLWSISNDFIIIEDSLARPDSIIIEMIKKFERNDQEIELDLNKIELPYDIELIGNKKFIRSVKGKNGWLRFQRNNPNTFGVIELSSLVFSDNKRYCALYVGYLRGGLNGYGCILIADLKGEPLIKCEIELWMA